MKALKLVIIFVVVLGGIVGAFLLLSGNNKGAGIVPPEDNPYETYRVQIENEWNQLEDWNEQVYKKNCDLVKQLSADRSGFQYSQPLMDLNTRKAVEIVREKIFAEWNSSSCRKKMVEKYINAVSVIENMDSNAASNPNVKQMKSVNATYIKAYSLANRHIGLKPSFDGQSWNSYESYSNSISSQRNAILADSNYKEYLSNIADVKSGLSSIPYKLAYEKHRFSNSLAHLIVDYYDDIISEERTRSQLNQLRSTRNRFDSDFPSNSELNSFIKKFADDVEENETRNENENTSSYGLD